MKRLLLGIGLVIILISFVSAEDCIIPTDGMIITEDTTFCEGEYYLPNGISIGVDNVILDCNSSTITGDSNRIGVSIQNVQGVTVKNCNLANYARGIYMLFSKEVTLINNNISNPYIGYSFVYNFLVDGSDFSHFNHTIDSSNTVNSKPIYYLKGENNSVYDENTNAGYFACISCNNVTIKNLVLTQNYHGILIVDTTNSLIINITPSFNNWGINLRDSHFNMIINNILNNNYNFGLELRNSDYNTIVNNVATKNNRGFSIANSNHNSIISNNLSSNSYGPRFYSSDSNIFASNIIMLTGPLDFDFSSFNFIYDNLFQNFKNADDDNINFWNTTKDCTKTNIIGGPCIGGNFWHDYAGEDLDGDGIGDTNLPYNSNGSIQNGGDYLPLVVIPDEDNDGVPNDEDECENTIGEQIVYGCSCEQILELKPGKDKGNTCSKGTIDIFTKQIGWAKDLFD